MRAQHVILNTPKPNLLVRVALKRDSRFCLFGAAQRLGDDSLMLKEASREFKTALSRVNSIGLQKAYCFYPDAWWRWEELNQGDLRLYSGRSKLCVHRA